MSRSLWASLVCASLCVAACASPPVAGPGTFRCVSCLASADCGGDSCVQFGTDVACAPACAADGSCSGTDVCLVYTTVDGAQASVCVPAAGACGVDLDSGVPDTGAPDAGSVTSCGGLVDPSSAACCSSCTGSPTCQTNGCYGGWWCNTATCHCQRPPMSCGSATDAGPVDAYMDDTGVPPPTGTVTAMGGHVSRLRFAVVGDSRPAVSDDTAGYPTAVVTQLYTDLQGLSPPVQFVLSTGDYCFANPRHAQAHSQMMLYMGARASYTGPVFFALGNHECTGYTASNCGPSGADGMPANYRSFLSDMLSTIGQTEPYYSVRVDSEDGSWTGKIVVAAPNAWDDAQDAWLRAQMAIPTTYTFVLRHEPADAMTAPGVTPMDAILAGSQYTLLIVGHTHTYFHARGSREVTIGLGGAPPTGRFDFGYVLIEQDPTGFLHVSERDYRTGALNDSFAVNADGTPH